MSVYITGDTHGVFTDVVNFADWTMSAGDTIIILGDVGLNYYLDSSDLKRKTKLSNLMKDKSVFCIRGNHEVRPEDIATYTTSEFWGGTVYIDPLFPNLIFAKDGEVYNIPIDDGFMKAVVIGGASSPDKDYRIRTGRKWFENEELTCKEWVDVFDNVEDNPDIGIVLSHTCPFNYMPTELFIPDIDQSKVSKRTEHNLQKIHNFLPDAEWYCGHYHAYKRVDNITFLNETFLSLDMDIFTKTKVELG